MLAEARAVVEEIGVGFGFLAQRRLEDRTNGAGHEAEYGGVRAARLAAHQIGLIAQDRGERGEGAIREDCPFFGRIAAGPLAMQAAADLAADHPGNDRPERRGHRIEKAQRPSLEIAGVEPARLHHEPVEVVLAHLLGRPGYATLPRRQAAFEIDVVALLQMQAD